MAPRQKTILSRLRSAGLTALQLSCLSLYYFDGYSQDDIAVEMSVSQAAVYKHLRLGLRKLRAAGLRPQSVENDFAPRIMDVDIADLHSLSPEDATAAW